MSSHNSPALCQLRLICSLPLTRACDLCLLACPTQASGQADLKQPPAYLMSSPVPSTRLPPCGRKSQPPPDQALLSAFLQLSRPITQLLSNTVEEPGLPGGPGRCLCCRQQPYIVWACTCACVHACARVQNLQLWHGLHMVSHLTLRKNKYY